MGSKIKGAFSNITTALIGNRHAEGLRQEEIRNDTVPLGQQTMMSGQQTTLLGSQQQTLLPGQTILQGQQPLSGHHLHGQNLMPGQTSQGGLQGAAGNLLGNKRL